MRRTTSGVSYDEDGSFICVCGLETVIRTFRRRTSNLWRRFHGCPNFGDNGCTFFRWAEDPIDIDRARELIVELRDENRAIRQQLRNSTANANMELCCEIAALKVDLDVSQEKLKLAASNGEKEAKMKNCYKFALIATWAIYFIFWVCNTKGKGEALLRLP